MAGTDALNAVRPAEYVGAVEKGSPWGCTFSPSEEPGSGAASTTTGTIRLGTFPGTRSTLNQQPEPMEVPTGDEPDGHHPAPEIVVESSNLSGALARCSLCGRHMFSVGGPWLYLDRPGDPPVCAYCGEDRAPGTTERMRERRRIWRREVKGRRADIESDIQWGPWTRP